MGARTRGLFSLFATVGFGWVRTRGRPFSVGYLAVQLPLGIGVFATSHTTVGAALLMVVLVMQTVLLSPCRSRQRRSRSCRWGTPGWRRPRVRERRWA